MLALQRSQTRGKEAPAAALVGNRPECFAPTAWAAPCASWRRRRGPAGAAAEASSRRLTSADSRRTAKNRDRARARRQNSIQLAHNTQWAAARLLRKTTAAGARATARFMAASFSSHARARVAAAPPTTHTRARARRACPLVPRRWRAHTTSHAIDAPASRRRRATPSTRPHRRRHNPPIAALALAHPELRRRVAQDQAPDFRSGRVRQVDALQADEDFVRDALHQRRGHLHQGGDS